MADLYLHIRLAEEVIKDIKYDFDKSLVYMGAQGPDPLYYNVSKKDGKEYRRTADLMHDKNTQMLFKNMVTHVKNNLTQATYSHLVGFIAHHALDVLIHPYVYYNVGIHKTDDPSTQKYRGMHLKFERSIDAVMIEKEKNIKANKLKFHQLYLTRKAVPLEVMNTMNHVLKQAYGIDHGGVMYLIGFNKMHSNVKRFVYDPFGLKKQILKIADPFTNTGLFPSDLSMYKHIENYDFLNESKKTWYHPMTNEPHNDSVLELFEQARVFAHSMIENVRKYIFDDKNIDLDTVFTNLSFNTGLNCDLCEDMQYFNLYRK